MKRILRLAIAPVLVFLLILSGCGEEKLAHPSISSFSPASGKPGTLVTIKGAHFGTGIPDNHVMFNGVLSTIISAQSNELIVRVPNEATTGRIKIVSWGMTVETETDFSVDPPPSITSFTPTSGRFEDEITITGDYFDPIGSYNTVTIGGVNTIVTSATKTQLVVKLMAGANTGKIEITTGGKTGTSDGNFTYIKSWTITPIAGSDNQGSTDGTGEVASFGSMPNIAVDSSQNLFVADEVNSLIRKIVGKKVSTITGRAGEGLKDGTVAEAMFHAPAGIAVDASGDVYISDSFNNLIRKISAGDVSTFAGTGEETFSNPRGVSVDSEGNLFVADNLNNVVRKVTPDGTVTTFANFNHPWGICIDKDDNVYVTEPDDNKISKITPDGSVTTIAGADKISDPTGVSVDYFGNIFFTEEATSKVRMITPDKDVTTIGDEATFLNPTGLATNAAGNVLYVSDQGNGRILKMEFR